MRAMAPVALVLPKTLQTMPSTDQDWERWGAQDPYFGVYSDDRFRMDVLSDDTHAAFFASGEVHVEAVFDALRRHFPDASPPRDALDFGCGVGRLALPLARRVDRVLGLDISASMLEEAGRNRDLTGCNNLALAPADEALSAIARPIDLLHSHIVFQHVPWPRGRLILKSLAERVAPGGLVFVQVLSAHRGGRALRALANARYTIRPLHWLWNLAHRRPLLDPPMQLHVYDLDVIQAELRELGFECRLEQQEWSNVQSTNVLARRHPGT